MITVLGIFLQGPKEDIERMFYSFWNHGATSGELEEWSDTCALFWIHGNGSGLIAHERLFWTMADMALFEILNKEQTKGTNPMLRAEKIAEQRLAEMDKVRWYVPVAKLTDVYTMGTSVRAEKPNGDFSDVLVGCLEGTLEQPTGEPEIPTVERNNPNSIADTATEEVFEVLSGIKTPYLSKYQEKGRIGTEHSRTSNHRKRK